uniref:PDZ and LIM domain protein 1-like n=1 Tax=Saccoglossus kowalevskii TaxID=10224 RepID=A0ABM0M056_SACKO|nr:PREDICTED: PDZ and LIM domain protein 1-like [Saccoglossus kowalevskii]
MLFICSDSPGHVDTSSPAYQSVHGSGGPAYANPTAQSRSFKMLQDMTEEDGGGGAGNYGTPQGSAQPGFRSVRPPSGGAAIGNKPPQTTPMCEDCDRGIVGPFVRVKGKSYHPECFTCKACHCNLKNQGYFEVGGKLYCERDARERVQPPEGADVVSMPGR